MFDHALGILARGKRAGSGWAPPMNILRSAPLGATRGGLVSQNHCTSYLTDKCSVQNRDVTGGKAVYARAVIEPGELIAVWSGRIIGADELDAGAGRAPVPRSWRTVITEKPRPAGRRTS